MEEQWILPDDLRDALREPLGPVIVDDELAGHVPEDVPVSTVGDVVTVHMVRAGYTPKVAIVDFMTRRRGRVGFGHEVRLIGDECIRVVNPPARITRSLWDAVERSYRSDGSVRIEVEGEEDLAFIPCVLLAPEGSLVMYGVPDEGMAVVRVNEKNRGIVADVLARFEHLGGVGEEEE